MADDPPRIRALGVRPIPVHRDGTEPRNSFWVKMEVDGVVHDVPIRRKSSNAHLPQALKGHPLGPEIKKAAMDAVYATLMQRIEAAGGFDAIQKKLSGEL